MNKFKEKLRKFMYGRYGLDELSQVMIYLALGLWVITIIFGSMMIDIVAFILIFMAYFRMFSKNTAKRYEELQRFLAWKQKVKNIPKTAKMRKTYHIYKCPGCRQKVRVPRGKGKIEISCPKCGAKFIKKS